MKPIRMFTVIALAALVATGFSLQANADTKEKPSKVNVSKLENCMMAPDGSTDDYQTTEGPACCSISLGYCVVCPNDVSKPCVVGKYGSRDLFSRLKTVAPTTNPLALAVTRRTRARTGFEQGLRLR